jgi:DNA-directed RNA polymerase specialized sigma subunit
LFLSVFLSKITVNHESLIHLDLSQNDEDYRNLKWVTYAERLQHTRNSPAVIQSGKAVRDHYVNSAVTKLTETRVMLIKKMLADPKRRTRQKMIARQFGISEMQISRIKSGENWGNVKF